MKLSDWLAAENLTAAEFGRRIGRTRAAVSNWLAGSRMPRRAELELIRQETAGAVTANDFMAPPAAPAPQPGAEAA